MPVSSFGHVKSTQLISEHSPDGRWVTSLAISIYSHQDPYVAGASSVILWERNSGMLKGEYELNSQQRHATTLA